MKKVETGYAVAFVAILAGAAFLIRGKHVPAKVQLPYPSQTADFIKTNQTVTAQVPEAPPVLRNLFAAYSVEANRVIATEILGQDEDAFAQRFTVKCLSADQSAKKFAGYGLNGEIVVVAARFRLAATNGLNGSKWLKDFQISESIESERFQGLDDPTTIRAVVSTLKEQVQNDAEMLRQLREIKP